MKTFSFLSFTRLAPLLALSILIHLPGAFGQTATDDDATDHVDFTPKKSKREKMQIIRSAHGQIVEMGKDVKVGVEERVREVVVIAGNAIVDGDVARDVVVISGDAKIDGSVGQLVVVLGSATLGPNARISRGVVVVGGTMKKDLNAEIHGEHIIFSFGDLMPNLRWLQDWLAKGLLWARPFPPQLGWVWGVAVAFLLLYATLGFIFPRTVDSSIRALERQPVGSFFAGVLFLVLFGPLLFMLIVSLVGILIIPFLFCALVAAAVFGKMAVYGYTGQRLGIQTRNNLRRGLPAALLAGTILFYLFYMVPVVGFIVWGLVSLIGLGAALIAMFASFQRSEVPAYTAVVAAAPGALAIPLSPPLMGSAGDAGTITSSPPPSPAETILAPRVGFWRRFFATFLDFFLLCLLLPATGPLFLLIWAAYHAGMWGWKGTTIGGIVMSIKIVRVDGKPVSYPVALVRCLSSFFSGMALFLGFFWAGWDREKQAWHDKIAGTVVVKVPRGISLI